MPNPPRLIYWDTAVIIHRIQLTPEYIDILREITDAAERGEAKIVLSTFVVAEVIKDPDGGVLSEEEDQKVIDLFENDYFDIRPITLPIARLSRQISRKHGVKPKDAVHLVTACYWDVPEFHTCDRGLINKTNLINTESGLPLVIETPIWRGQLMLPNHELPTPSGERHEEIAVIETSENTPAEVPEISELNERSNLSTQSGHSSTWLVKPLKPRRPPG